MEKVWALGVLMIGALFGIALVGCGKSAQESASEAPKAQIAKTQAPSLQVPSAQVPNTETPNAQSRDVEAPATQLTQTTAAKEKTPATIQDGMTVEFDYTLRVDGAVVDSSEKKGPLKYVHGKGQIIPGLEKQLAGLSVGDVRDFTVSPEQAYGQINPKAVIELPKEKLPKNVTPQVGMVLTARNQAGRPIPAKIKEVKDKSVVLDLNHPLAGKALHFHIRVADISPST